MAETKISALTALTTVAEGDLVPVVDVSDTTMAPSGTTKKVAAADVVAIRSEKYDVRRSGVVADGVTDDTTAMASALTVIGSSAGTGTTGRRAWGAIPYGRTVIAAGLTLPARCGLDCNGSRIQSPASSTSTILSMGAGAEIRNASLLGSGASFGQKGIAVTGERTRIYNVNLESFGGSAIYLDEGLASLEDCFTQNCLLDAASLADYTGVLHLTINANDTYVSRSEFNASLSALSASGFCAAVCVAAGGGTAQFDRVIGAFADLGFYIAAPHTFMSGCRPEFNWGHGMIAAANSGGRMVGCVATNNSKQTTNTYDAFNFANNTQWHVAACEVRRTTGNVHRYGFNDASNGSTNFSQYDSTNWVQPGAVGTAPISVVTSFGSNVSPMDGHFRAIAAAATTQDVQASGWPSTRWTSSSVSAVNFTDFTNEVPGMIITVLGDGNTTVVHNTATIRTLTGANTLLAANTMYQFVNRAGVWWQI